MRCKKIFAGIIVLIALVVAILASTVSIDTIEQVMLVVKFFDIMIPILAVGALVKYLFCGHSKKCGCCGTACNKCGSDKP